MRSYISKESFWLAGLGHHIEEINYTCLQRILGAYDEESIPQDQLLKDFRAVSQMVGGEADVGSDGVPHQRLWVVSECRC